MTLKDNIYVGRFRSAGGGLSITTGEGYIKGLVVRHLVGPTLSLKSLHRVLWLDILPCGG